jgi:hypothetical protein
MKKCKIDKLCDAINAADGLTYPEPGYLYYANIVGDGRKHRNVYATMKGGGVCAVFNGKNTRETVQTLTSVLERR